MNWLGLPSQNGLQFNELLQGCLHPGRPEGRLVQQGNRLTIQGRSRRIGRNPKETKMNINDQFPTKYLKASDLGGQSVNVVMSHVANDKVGDDQKPILFFQGHQKGLVLNKTNARNVANIYGPETDGWQGKAMLLVPVMVDFQGQSTPALRLHPPGLADPARVQAQTVSPATPVQTPLIRSNTVTAPANAGGIVVEQPPAGGFTEANPPPVGSPVTPQAQADIDDEIPF